MKALEAFESLGLDLTTGISKETIPVLEMENKLKKRLTGNGSTIRRDNKPWSLFNFSVVKSGNSVEGWSFNGYKSYRDMITELNDQIASSEDRMKKEERSIDDRKNKINNIILSTNNLDKKAFSKVDILYYLR